MYDSCVLYKLYDSCALHDSCEVFLIEHYCLDVISLRPLSSVEFHVTSGPLSLFFFFPFLQIRFFHHTLGMPPSPDSEGSRLVHEVIELERNDMG